MFDKNNVVLIGIRPPDGAIVSPRLVLESYSTYELYGDEDQEINPGETVALEFEILNSPSWHDASSFELELITDELGISISEPIIIIGQDQQDDVTNEEGVWQQFTNGNWGYFEVHDGKWSLIYSQKAQVSPPEDVSPEDASKKEVLILFDFL